MQLAERALARDAVGAAHLERAVAARLQVADERPPVVPFVATHRALVRSLVMRSASRIVHSPGTPLSSWRPRSTNSMPEPATRSRTVDVTSTSPGAGERRDARADVHRDAGDVVALQLDLAGVEPGAHLDAQRPRRRGDRVRARDRARRPVERGEDVVAARVDLAPAEALELAPLAASERVEQLAPLAVAQLGEPLRSTRRCR